MVSSSWPPSYKPNESHHIGNSNSHVRLEDIDRHRMQNSDNHSRKFLENSFNNKLVTNEIGVIGLDESHGIERNVCGFGGFNGHS